MNWMLDILEKLTCWFPRPYLVQPDEAGVRITLGKYIKDLTPGWYIDIPLIHTFIKVNVALQGVKFEIQSVTTKDDVPLAIRGAVRYHISNARKAIFETDDFDKSLEAVATGAISNVVSTQIYADLQDRQTLQAELTKAVREAAQGWGIKLQNVYLSDFAKAINIRLLNDYRS
jgi:regulator of protease activity HflC (stomatin/prohibitin superfamily)